jgi:hypothetical protein
MKQALEALEFAGDLIAPITENCQCQICLAHTALRQAIEQAEKQDGSCTEVGTNSGVLHKEWVGLTDEEVEAIYDQEDHVDLVLLTETKLKEKNVPQS